MTATDGLTNEIGRRERKKLATRDAIRAAARDLFRSKGFDATTIYDIAEAADVAERTFYRHFESKEAVALADLRLLGAAFAALIAARPASESPIEAIRGVVADLATTPAPRNEMIEDLVLVDANPSAAAQIHRQLLDTQDTLTDHFAERLGVATNELNPRLLAAALVAMFQACVRTWAANGAQGTPWQYALEAVDIYAEGLAGIRRNS